VRGTSLAVVSATPRRRGAPSPDSGSPGQGGPGAPGCGRSFGEEGGTLTYGDYLRLSHLLDQQIPRTDPPAHDELLFITIHQIYELWFKQLLHEVEAARDAMDVGEMWRARHLLRRVHVIERLLVEQIGVLETMTPQHFMEFREALRPASGFQSVQFRELEFLSGAKDPDFVKRFRGISGVERERLSRRLAEPSLWDAYLALLGRHGLPVGSTEEVRASLGVVAGDPHAMDDLWEIAEALLTHDELAGLWRTRHVQMVERQIGTKSGTGGSTGAPYLRSRLGLRYYPLLWELRTQL
jgi:tryptophan 2,3-dioxygenase